MISKKIREATRRLAALADEFEVSDPEEYQNKVIETVRGPLEEAIRVLQKPSTTDLDYMVNPNNHNDDTSEVTADENSAEVMDVDDDIVDTNDDVVDNDDFNTALDELPEPGDGDIVVGDEILYVHEYLGDQWTQMIMDTEAIPPLTLTEEGVMVELPGMSTEPYQHQLQSAPKLCHMCDGPFRGALLADAKGLGRRLTVAMAVMLSGKTRHRYHGAPALVITRVSRVEQWTSELESHWKKDHRPRCLKLRDPSVTASTILVGGYDFVIVSYEYVAAQHKRLLEYKEYHALVRSKGITIANATQPDKKMPARPVLSLFSEIYKDTGRPFPFLILDEVEHVKNQHSKTHIAIKQLPYMAAICILDTILPKQWTDIYGVIDFLKGHPFVAEEEFVRVFLTQNGNRVKDPPPTLRNRLIKFLMVMTVGHPASILKLPGALEKTTNVDLTASEKEFTDALVREGPPVIPYIYPIRVPCGTIREIDSVEVE